MVLLMNGISDQIRLNNINWSTWLARRMREERLARCMSPDIRLVMECRLHSAALLWEAPPSLERLGRPKIDSLRCIPSQ